MRVEGGPVRDWGKWMVGRLVGVWLWKMGLVDWVGLCGYVGIVGIRSGELGIWVLGGLLSQSRRGRNYDYELRHGRVSGTSALPVDDASYD